MLHTCFPVHIVNFYLFWKTSANGCFWLLFYFSNLYVFGCLFTIIKENYDLLLMKKMFIKIRLCNPIVHDFKEHVKIVEIYMVKINVPILNRLKIMGFFVNASFIRKHDAILNKTVIKLLTILTKYFFHIWTLQATLTKISVTELKFLTIKPIHQK